MTDTVARNAIRLKILRQNFGNKKIEMNLFSYLFILQVLNACLSQDIEFEGIVRLGDSFMKNLKDESIKNLLTVKQPINVRRARYLKKVSPSIVMRASSVGVNRTGDLMNYVDHIQTEGVQVINNTINEIINILEIDTKIKNMMDNFTNNYISKIQVYFDDVTKKKNEFVIDDELMFLDMVESACRILYTSQKKLLNQAIMAIHTSMNNSSVNHNDSLASDVQNLSERIIKQKFNVKKREMRYLCIKYEVCRPYPGLTDFVAEFIVELLKLSKSQMQIVLTLMKFIVNSNKNFFDKIIKKDDEYILANEIKLLLNDTTKTTETLMVVVNVIRQRFNIIYSSNLKLKLRTQAIRILLDIVDKAYEKEDEDVLAIEFNIVVSDLRSWLNNDRIFPEYGITNLVNHILLTLERNMSRNAKKEIAVLVETILNGSSKNKELYTRLFSHGSKFVKGEDSHNNIDL